MAAPWEKYQTIDKKTSSQSSENEGSGPWNKYSNPQEAEPVPVGTKMFSREELSGEEIPYSTRAALSFASGDEEKRGYLEKEFPMSQFGYAIPAGEKEKVPVVLLPGEKKARYLNRPDFTVSDTAELAGMAPSIVLSPLLGTGVPGAIAAGSGGEFLRKEIGHNIVGIPRRQGLLSTAADIAVPGIFSGIVQKGINLIPGAKEGIQSGAKSVAQKARGLLSKTAQEEAEALEGQVLKNKFQGGGQADDAISQTTGELQPKNFAQQVENENLNEGLLNQAREKLKKAQEEGLDTRFPTAKVLEEAESSLPDLEFKPLPYQKNMLNSRADQKVLSAAREAPTENARFMSEYEMAQKNEAANKLRDTVQSIGNKPHTSETAFDAGNEIINNIKNKYKENKKIIAPLFQEIDNVRLNPVDDASNVRMNMVIDHSDLGIKMGEDGKLFVTPFDAKKGISREANNAFRQTVKSLNSDQLTFKDMQRIREYLRVQMDPMNPKAWAPVEKLRESMLKYMEDVVEVNSKGQAPGVRDTFRKWAINEKNLDQFEKMIGGKVESLDSLLKANPENVLRKLFQNTNTIETTKSILGDQEFNNAMSDFIEMGIKKSTKDGTFSSNTFKTQFLDKNPWLQRYLPKDSFKRIKSLNDVMRLTADHPSANPSGTASAMQAYKALEKGDEIPTSATQLILKGGSKFVNYFKDRNRDKLLGEIIEGKKPISALTTEEISLFGSTIQNLKNAYNNPTVRNVGRGILSGEAARESRGLLEQERR